MREHYTNLSWGIDAPCQRDKNLKPSTLNHRHEYVSWKIIEEVELWFLFWGWTERIHLFSFNIHALLYLQTFGKTGIFSISDVELGGRSCRYAMEGCTWKVIREYYSNQIPKILKYGVIFARMSSDQKQQVIQALQTLGYQVGEYFL